MQAGIKLIFTQYFLPFYPFLDRCASSLTLQWSKRSTPISNEGAASCSAWNELVFALNFNFRDLGFYLNERRLVVSLESPNTVKSQHEELELLVMKTPHQFQPGVKAILCFTCLEYIMNIWNNIKLLESSISSIFIFLFFHQGNIRACRWTSPLRVSSPFLLSRSVSISYLSIVRYYSANFRYFK